MTMETLLLGVISALWGLLLVCGGFLINRVFTKLDDLGASVSEVRETCAALSAIVKGEM